MSMSILRRSVAPHRGSARRSKAQWLAVIRIPAARATAAVRCQRRSGKREATHLQDERSDHPASHDGAVRVITPGAYGNKSIKWVQRIVLTNDYKANDSDAELNNDTESPLKTRARFLNAPKELPPDTPAPLTGMAQVGVLGARQSPVLHPFPGIPVARGQPVLEQGRLEGCRDPAAARRLGWRAAWGQVADQHRPDRSGQGCAVPLAHAAHAADTAGNWLQRHPPRHRGGEGVSRVVRRAPSHQRNVGLPQD